MTVRLTLSSSLYVCPQNWFNFIKDLESRLEHNDQNGFSVETINQELARFNARYVEGKKYQHAGVEFVDRASVEFDSEESYTMFVLLYGNQGVDPLRKSMYTMV